MTTGLRQLRLLSPTADALRPLLGRAAQVVLTDDNALNCHLEAVTATTLRLRLSARLPAVEWPLTAVREVIVDHPAPW